MGAAKRSCLAIVLADASWHVEVTDMHAESQIPTQVLPSVPEDLLCHMLPLERSSYDNLPLTLGNLPYPQHRRSPPTPQRLLSTFKICIGKLRRDRSNQVHAAGWSMMTFKESKPCWTVQQDHVDHQTKTWEMMAPGEPGSILSPTVPADARAG